MAILAYNRNLGGRKLLYRLTEIFIKLGDFEHAEELFNEYSKVDSNLSKLPFIPEEYMPKYKVVASITPSTEELEENPRARSSRLRVIEKIKD